ncbi:MAG TPA: AsmA family protein [Noviherbaspirillum sp.]|nr:AsmA family protein [Noviherbaspirillum sp.]
MSRATRIAAWSGLALLVLLLACIAALLSFDWNRVKPWINTRVSEATGRSFVIHGDLALTWHAPKGERGWRAWVPWPRLNAQDVSLSNPPWAKMPQMARVREITFSINPLPLLQQRLVIPSLGLNNPQLSIERLADGRNNWTFKQKAGEPSAWKVDLQSLVFNNGSVILFDAVKRANLKIDVSSLGNGSAYQVGWRIGGMFNGEAASGTGRAGAVLSLQRPDAQYPIEAKLRVGKTSIDAKGTLTEPRKLAALDLKLKFSGVSMAHLYPLIGVTLPETRPFTTEGRLIGSPRRNTQGGHWTYEKFTGRVGSSDLSGSLRYQSPRANQPRPLLEGTVVSSLLNFNDLSPLIGADSDASRAQRGVRTIQPDDKVLPVETFKTERWTAIDADVQFTGKKIIRQKELPINNLVTRLQLKDGILSLAPLKFGVAGGSLTATLRLDSNKKPVQADMRMSARHLKLNELFPTLRSMQASLGEINGDAALRANGNSVAGLLGSSNGDMRLIINQGTISKFLLEAAGLNIGSVVITRLFGDKQVALNCAVSDFEIRKGVMHTRAFVVDTRDATIYVKGDIRLGQEQLDLTVLPETKGVRLISLRSPLYVNGPFKKPQVGIDKGAVALRAGSAIALGVLAPVASALIPLVNVGPGEHSECGTLLAQANAQALAGSGEHSSMDSSGE